MNQNPLLFVMDGNKIDGSKHAKDFRGGSRAAATSKMECFVIIVNGWKHIRLRSE